MSKKSINKVLKYLPFVLILVAIIVFLIYFSLPKEDQAKQAKVVFLDVGQGDAIYYRSGSFDLLIDGGPGGRVVEELSKHLPFYDRTIELVVLTHPHADHMQGLIKVLERYQVDKVVETGVECQSKLCQEWNRSLEEKSIKRDFAQKGQRYEFANGELEILFPFQNYQDLEIDNLNNSSIVSCLKIGQYSFLLTGDAEKEVEEILLQDKDNFSDCQNPTVLKVAHHGSKSSTSEEFLDFLNPEYAVMQVGQDNKFYHPHFVTLEKFANKKTTLLRNDLNGSVVYQVNELGKLEVETGKPLTY
ncbi:MBL fold metallo-hydrolase [Patescibacteria group bacterium]|nr:MBL fold metallo-hydrolase [Patescibacteria group bacterium]